MLPVARGANGQPPMPPTEASRTVAPASTAAYAFARPVFRVLCRCTPTGGPSPVPRPTRWQTCGREPVDELRARLRRQRLRVVLEPVARPDIADRDDHTTLSAFSSSSCASLSPSSPP